jgi:hypothetical protein
VDEETAKKLREPFPPEVVGKLPRLTCKACSEKRCQEHKKTKCDVCGNFISPRHIHLDYVGHAAVTDRLLQADPTHNWKPFTVDELAGVNAQKGELWIWLTIAGVTRAGVGDGDTAKIRIGDAIRNAAMRFGVALDLWAKEDLSHEDSGAEKQAVVKTDDDFPFEAKPKDLPSESVLMEIRSLATDLLADKSSESKKLQTEIGKLEWRTDPTEAQMAVTKLRLFFGGVAA